MTDPINLDTETDQEFFEFIVDGNNYRMRYPTTEEVEGAQKLKDDENKADWLYSFIQPVNKESQPIKEVLKKKNIKFLKRFNEMVTTEFGL